MSQENVEIVRRGFEHVRSTGEPLEEIFAPDFVWDMGTFRDLVGLGEQYRSQDGELDRGRLCAGSQRPRPEGAARDGAER